MRVRLLVRYITPWGMCTGNALHLKEVDHELKDVHVRLSPLQWRNYLRNNILPGLMKYHGVRKVDIPRLRFQAIVLGGNREVLFPIVREEGFQTGDVKKYGWIEE